MIRGLLMTRGMGSNQHFQHRGKDVTRLEGFSDAAFGFAITLLTVSQQVPTTFADLQRTLGGFVAFAFCFFILVTIWYNHYLFFRRFGLEDGVTVGLNSLLLFVVLLYIYPLKFAANVVIAYMHEDKPTVRLPNGTLAPLLGKGDLPLLLDYYFIGSILVSLILGLLYFHAYRHRDALQLNVLERFETKAHIANQALSVGVGLLAIALMFALQTPLRSLALKGFTAAVPLLVFLPNAYIKRRRKQLRTRFLPPQTHQPYA